MHYIYYYNIAKVKELRVCAIIIIIKMKQQPDPPTVEVINVGTSHPQQFLVPPPPQYGPKSLPVQPSPPLATKSSTTAPAPPAGNPYPAFSIATDSTTEQQSKCQPSQESIIECSDSCPENDIDLKAERRAEKANSECALYSLLACIGLAICSLLCGKGN